VRSAADSPAAPAVSLRESLAVQKVLDAWRHEVGTSYPFEKPGGIPPTHLGKTRAFDASPVIPTIRLAGVDKPVSRLVMGCDNQQTLAHAAVMFDAFVAQGGTTFDTAYVYGGGLMERLLGQWIAERRCRDRVVIIAKGAVTPYCVPAAIPIQLQESLDRMQTDHADLYIMHRDNPDIPAGEFIDALNELRNQGLIREFGGSNWTLSRLQEANAYARRAGKHPMTLLSNNFALARMVNPVWSGCVACSEDAFRDWLIESKSVTNFAWSSQARGFFTARAAPEKREDRELSNSWYSADNFERRRRAVELAGRLGVEPINIALAYVLCQPFDQVALVGPRTLEELRLTLAGLSIQLTPQQMQWLDLRREAIGGTE
jgi:aryl-alcohol dehydrogenase-like predicted oxidoreductase